MQDFSPSLQAQRLARKNWFFFALILVICLGLFNCLVLILHNHPQQVAYAINMTVDSKTTYASAVSMLKDNSWLFSPETYHSTGMQVLAASLMRIFGTSPLTIKLFSWCCYLLSVVLLFLNARKLGLTNAQGFLAAALLATSSLVQAYCATLQYEVVAMTLLMALAYAYWHQHFFWFGIFGATLCFFRLHFLIVQIPFWIFLLRRKNQTETLRSFLGLVSLLGPLYLSYALHFQSLSGFQEVPLDHYKKWLCLGAEGWTFPYFSADTNSHCGSDFILNYPVEYISLLLRRFGYLVGLIPDVWWVPAFPLRLLSSEYQALANLVYVTALQVLYFFTARKAIRTKNKNLLICAMMPVCVAIPFLVAGASTRFLVPIIPFFCLLVANEVKWPSFAKSETT